MEIIYNGADRKILGIPEQEYEYEFMVVTKREDGDFDWYGSYCTSQIACDVAERVNGIICHNLRISGRKKE